MTVTTTVEVYEVDDKKVEIGSTKEISVISHWNYGDRVILQVEGKSVTVIAKDLKLAIENATNVRRY